MVSVSESNYQLSVLNPSSHGHSHGHSHSYGYGADTLLPHSTPTRRILSKLDKNSIADLVTIWLGSASNPSILPPILTNKPTPTASSSSSSSSSAHQDLSSNSIKRINNNQTCDSLSELIHLWDVTMRQPKITKVRMVERILETDWKKGFSFHMLAMIDGKYLESNPNARSWMTGKFNCRDGLESSSRATPTPASLQLAFSSELSHYFSHHLHLYPQESSSTSKRSLSSEFIHFRLVSAPSPSDLCNSSPLHILVIPKSRFFLFSGLPASNASGGGATELRLMTFSALAKSLAWDGYSISIPQGINSRRGESESSKLKPKLKPVQEEVENLNLNPSPNLEKDDEEESSSSRIGIAGKGSLAELKGKDPFALKLILLGSLGDHPGAGIDQSVISDHGLVGGGKSRGLKRGNLEENPLSNPEKRSRSRKDSKISKRLNGNQEIDRDAEFESDAFQIENLLIQIDQESGYPIDRNSTLVDGNPTLKHPAQLESERRRMKWKDWQDSREVEELFGEENDMEDQDQDQHEEEEEEEEDSDLPKIQRIDYELHLPLRTWGAYHSSETLSTNLSRRSDASRSGSKEKEAIRLRLEGPHVLAGLRQLVSLGLDRERPCDANANADITANTNTNTKPTSTLNSRNQKKKQQLEKEEGKGLPDWLINVQGSNVVVGKK